MSSYLNFIYTCNYVIVMSYWLAISDEFRKIIFKNLLLF